MTAATWVPAVAPARREELALHSGAQRSGKPGAALSWRARYALTPSSHDLLTRHANIHVVVVILRGRFRRSRFGLRNHRFWGGFVPTSSRGGRRRGHPGFLAPGMLSGTACRLLLYGGVAVALATDAFPRLTLLALGPVPLLVTLLATHKALRVVVPTVPLCFYTSSLGTLA